MFGKDIVSNYLFKTQIENEGGEAIFTPHTLSSPNGFQGGVTASLINLNKVY